MLETIKRSPRPSRAVESGHPKGWKSGKEHSSIKEKGRCA